MNFIKSTRQYETWVRRQVPLIPADLSKKHQAMSEDVPFAFLRATYYRWAQVWAEIAGDLARSPVVLAVGDLHVDNFGTWRDSEGRLVWGINDFDEADKLPLASDLLRLAVSAVIAVREAARPLSPKRAISRVLDGYIAGVKAGGSPFVLEERHSELRTIAESRLRADAAKSFWDKLEHQPTHRERIPKLARRLLGALVPRGTRTIRIVHRPAGLGSLGRRRYAAIGELRGGAVAREVKELVLPASAWARHETSGSLCYRRIVERSVRCADPFLSYRSGWIGRRLSPSNSRIEIHALDVSFDVDYVLHSMGFETANIHLGSARPKPLLSSTRALKASALADVVRGLAKLVLADQKRWRGR